MGYSLKPRKRKYVEGYGFFSFAKIFASDSVQKLMDTAKTTGIDTAENVSKMIVQK